MNVVVEDLGSVVIIYVDNIIIFTETIEEHWAVASEVLRRVNACNMRLNPDKCEFAYRALTILGVRVSAGTLQMDPRKAQVVNDFPRPTTVQELQRFLGMVNYVRPFLRDLSMIAAPLHALSGGQGRLAWSEEAEQSFLGVKALLARAILLTVPTPGALYVLYTDASDKGVGAALCVVGKGSPFIIDPVNAYASQRAV